ncbi:unnamed protein product [marine sediment metagenome]|uniref:Uncharacterized protein n=1 Tax=marine sediment metagenome TaxID=412755 RepID=X1AHU8_9ZZZZ
MPRKPTDEVIEHRITLGAYERQIVSDLAGSYQFNRIATPVITFVNDNTSLLLIGTVIGVSLDKILSEPNWRDIVTELSGLPLDDWLETQNLVGGAIGATIAAFFSGGLAAPVGFAAGVAAVEIGESLSQSGADTIVTIEGLTDSNNIAATTSFAITTWKVLNNIVDGDI